MSITRTTPIALATLALALGACGGDSDDSSRSDGGGKGSDRSGERDPAPRPEPVSKQEFVERADALCREFTDETQRMGEEIRSQLAAPDPELKPDTISELRRLNDDFTESFEELDLPDDPKAREIRDLLVRSNEISAKASEALAKGKTPVALNVRAIRVSGRLRTLVQGYGFKACGKRAF